MIDDMRIKWEDLKGKHVRIKNTIQLPLLNNETNALVLDVNTNCKKVKIRFEGAIEGVCFSILKDYTLTAGRSLREDSGCRKELLSRYRFVRELTKWEKLEFEVTDYIDGFYDKSGIDFNSEIKAKSKAECEYMQKYAEFKMEEYLPMKSIAVFVFVGILTSQIPFIIGTNAPVLILLSPEDAYRSAMLSFLLISIAIYSWYLKYRKRYQELILRLEARILSDS